MCSIIYSDISVGNRKYKDGKVGNMEKTFNICNLICVQQLENNVVFVSIVSSEGIKVFHWDCDAKKNKNNLLQPSNTSTFKFSNISCLKKNVSAHTYATNHGAKNNIGLLLCKQAGLTKTYRFLFEQPRLAVSLRGLSL